MSCRREQGRSQQKSSAKGTHTFDMLLDSAHVGTRNSGRPRLAPNSPLSMQALQRERILLAKQLIERLLLLLLHMQRDKGAIEGRRKVGRSKQESWSSHGRTEQPI